MVGLWLGLELILNELSILWWEIILKLGMLLSIGCWGILELGLIKLTILLWCILELGILLRRLIVLIGRELLEILSRGILVLRSKLLITLCWGLWIDLSVLWRRRMDLIGYRVEWGGGVGYLLTLVYFKRKYQ